MPCIWPTFNPKVVGSIPTGGTAEALEIEGFAVQGVFRGTLFVVSLRCGRSGAALDGSKPSGGCGAEPAADDEA
jgi:hypothetical protein